MQLRTHLALGLAVALYFLPHVKEKVFFIPIVLVASLIPVFDNVAGLRGHIKPLKIFYPLRKILRTYTFCIFITLLLALFTPVYSLPFFLGYSFTLFTEAFSTEGIQPFWPLKKESKGHIATGGGIEKAMFAIFLIFDIALLVKLLTVPAG